MVCIVIFSDFSCDLNNLYWFDSVDGLIDRLEVVLCVFIDRFLK